LHFVAHGAKGLVVVLRLLRRIRRGGEGAGIHRQQEQYKWCDSNGAPHFWPPAARVSCAGGGRIGGRSVDACFFCTSSSEVRIAGEAAETGTEPDSAPQYPLKTSGVSPVATILVSAASGVPTMSTPRTSSSGRPSGKTLYTTSGKTWKACGCPRPVKVNPPAMSSISRP